MPSALAESPWKSRYDSSGAWTLLFDRPGTSQNSLDDLALNELARHLEMIQADPAATHLVIRSAKPRGFCAGADLRAIAACRTMGEIENFARLGQSVFEQLRRLPIPTVAVIHGVCLGGGLELALACDYRVAVADPSAPPSLGTPEVRLGLVPGWGAISALPRRIGLEAGLTLLLDGQPIDANEALRFGLVDRIAEPSGLDQAVAAVVTELSRAAPWPPEGWLRALDAARSRVADDLARLRLLDILETDLTRGWEAGLAAAANGLAEMAFLPTARAAIAGFLSRKK